MPTHLSATAKQQLDASSHAYPGDARTKASHPGTVLGVINHQGEMIYLEATGPETVDQPGPLRPDTVFPIFSCTKVITAMAIMHMVERGGIDLDAPASKYVPALADMNIIVDAQDSGVRTAKADVPITTRMLMTHTAGFSYSWYNDDSNKWYKQNPDASGLYSGAPLVSEPGSKFEYGIAMDWAGEVLSAAAGMSLEDYFREHSFKPLGSTDITFDPWSKPESNARIATIHAWNVENHMFTTRDYPKHPELPLGKGGSGLFSTAADYLQLLAVSINRGQGANGVQILRPETVEQMFTNQLALTPDQGALGLEVVVPSTDPDIVAIPLTLLPGERKGWGLSFLSNLDDVPGGRRARSAEWGGIGNSSWIADPSSKIAMVIFNSALPYGSEVSSLFAFRRPTRHLFVVIISMLVPAFVGLLQDLHKAVYAAGALVEE